MNNKSHDFDTWFDALCAQVLDLSGVDFRCQDSVRQDYEDGRDVSEVAQEIADEYE